MSNDVIYGFQLELHIDGTAEPILEISKDCPVMLPSVGDQLNIEFDDDRPERDVTVYKRKLWMMHNRVYSVTLWCMPTEDD